MAEEKTACIVCQKEGVPGHLVKDDSILRTIRDVKTRLGIRRGFTLVVCDADIETYKKKRQNFEKMAVLHATAAVIAVAILFLAPLILGAPFSIVNLFFALILGSMIAALAVLSYIPGLETREWAGAKPGLANALSPAAPEEKKKETPREIAKRLSSRQAPRPAQKPAAKPASRAAKRK